MYRIVALVTLLASAFPIAAQTPMNAAEFEAYTTGKTLNYGNEGFLYGIEEYLENRRVRWSFIGGECQDGQWYPAGDMICFVYDRIDTPQCWTFFDSAGGLLARFENDPENTELVETRQSQEPLICLGPTPGV